MDDEGNHPPTFHGEIAVLALLNKFLQNNRKKQTFCILIIFINFVPFSQTEIMVQAD
jgi:hypothetical protein